MYFRATAVAAAILTTACFVDNGSSAADPATSSGEPASSTTNLATSSGIVDPTTTPSGTTSTGDPTTTADATTGVVPTTDCWDQDLGTWPLMGTPLTLGADILDPYLTADGLRLYYLGSDRRPYLSTRADPLDPFPTGVLLAQWLGLADDVVFRFPTVLLTDQLMFLSNSEDIYVALATPQDPEKFTLPVLLPGVVNTADYQEASLTASADAQVLIVTRNDGPALEPLPFTPTLHQFIRTGDNNDPYAGGGDVTPQNPPFNLASCPALSPDGLRLFYTSTVGDTFDPGDYSTFAIYYTTRPALDAAWDPVTQVPGLEGPDGIPCVSSVTADGCQLVYYTLTILGTEPTRYLAQRASP